MHQTASDQFAERNKDLNVVGIGASAGGVKALKQLLGRLPDHTDCAYVIVQHLSSKYRSLLVDLLAKITRLTVVTADHGQPLQANTVYIAPQNKDIFLRQKLIQLKSPQTDSGPKPSVDIFFASLAENFGDRSIAVILSGTGYDGAYGIRAIKAMGGIVIAQKPETAKCDGMPRNAIRTGVVDLVLEPEQIGPQIAKIVQTSSTKIIALTDNTADDYTAIIRLLLQRHQIDFGHYKENTLRHQLTRRLIALQIDSLAEYLSYVRDNPEELDALFQSFLISVTWFFRDHDHIVALKQYFKKRLQQESAGTPMRIWVPGCATGEEVYTIAILLAELLGRENPDYRRIKIFGTDIDLQAIEMARRGLYPETAVEGLPSDLRERYFTTQGRDYRINKFVREQVIFAKQDVIDDPPFLNVDLISCRNLLIYFKTELQQQLFSVFHYALKTNGLLFLGKSESIGNSKLFTPIDKRHRLFVKHNQPLSRPQLQEFLKRSHNYVQRGKKVDAPPKQIIDQLDRYLLDNFMPPSVLVDQDFQYIKVFKNVNQYLTFEQVKADAKLENMVAETLRTPLLSLLCAAREDHKSVEREVFYDPKSSENLVLSVYPIPANAAQTEKQYFLVCFKKKVRDAQKLEQKPPYPLSEATQQHVRQLETALTDAREHLQDSLEKLETSNEELQSVNQELQACTEELETTNQELRATHEKLVSVDKALASKSKKLSTIHAYLDNFQNASDISLIVVNKNLHIVHFTPQAMRIFSILPNDIGRPLNLVKRHVNIEALPAKISQVTDSGTVHTEKIGRENIYLMKISPYILSTNLIDGAVICFTDITLLHRIEHELILRTAALEKAADGVIICDARAADQPIVYASESFCRLTGYNNDEIIGRNCRFLQGSKTDPETVLRIRETLSSMQPFLGELVNYRKDGSMFINQLRINPIFDRAGHVTHFVGVQTDLTRLRQLDEAKSKQANYDPLTGLPNRILFTLRLKRWLGLASRHGSHCYVLFIDLDGFKEINDTLGHRIGDEVLVKTAARLEACVRETDAVGRFGGDEFMILLPDIENLETVVLFANKLLKALSKPFSLITGLHRLTASIGVSAYPEDGHDAEILVQHAATAMYKAKHSGRNGLAFFSAEMKTEAIRRTQLKQAIFDAIKKLQFQIHYQPIVDLNNRSIAGAEALLRWNHPQQGLLMPDNFLRLAEESDQILAIGQWVLEQAIEDMRHWQMPTDDPFRLSINLSPRQIQSGTLQTYLTTIPESVMHHLEFEITESLLLEHQQTVLETLAMIRAKHGRVSIDDFGTGYSSLKYLQNFPVDTVKIDREFIANSQSNRKGKVLIDTILTLAKQIDADVVAEGIETEEQLQLLIDRHCRYGQGYFFYRPISADEFSKLLH